MTTSIFNGTWRITWMSAWDQDYMDLEGLGHITFSSGRSGSLRFGAMQAQMDCRAGPQTTQRIEFTWHGFDEGDEISGRGHADIVNDELRGHLYFHLGDDSAFRATRIAAATRKNASFRGKRPPSDMP